MRISHRGKNVNEKELKVHSRILISRECRREINTIGFCHYQYSIMKKSLLTFALLAISLIHSRRPTRKCSLSMEKRL